MCRRIYDCNIVNCDVEQPIHLTSILCLPFSLKLSTFQNKVDEVNVDKIALIQIETLHCSGHLSSQRKQIEKLKWRPVRGTPTQTSYCFSILLA